MAKQPIPLRAVPTIPGQPEYQALLAWPFPVQPFYETQVLRLLREEIPQRMIYGELLMVFVYHDPDGNKVGFGTLDLCNDYAQFTDGKLHAYLPVLGVHPNFQKRGHGRSIVEHLIAEAVMIAQSFDDCSDLLFLDVYTANTPAISLYERQGFVTVNQDSPIPDPEEHDEPYVIMAKKVLVASPAPPPPPS